MIQKITPSEEAITTFQQTEFKLEDETVPHSTTETIDPKESLKTSKYLTKEEKLQRRLEREEATKRFKAYTETLPDLDYPSHYKVDCVNTLEEANARIRHLMDHNKNTFFGLDFEWKPTFIKGQPENKISLVQICTADTILLIQLSWIQGFPQELRNFFENKELLKGGVNIGADGLKVFRDFKIFTNGLVELSELAESTGSPKLNIIHLRSLNALTAIMLDQKMAKGGVRVSDWSKKNLSPKQIRYAALDAYASYQLLTYMNQLRDKTKPIRIRHLIDEASAIIKNAEKKQTKIQTKKYKSQSPPISLNNRPLFNSGFPTSTTTIIKKKS
ncbi:MAG: ribonuclease H-like domain-containing protein [Benjaminiella poitrasii]|nr:MAG: ribonuclease H-like domain-containing protein [Benjaminiella poitrasii]